MVSSANILIVCSDAREIKKLSTLLHLGKSCGTDLEAVESLWFAYPSICLYLRILFNLRIMHFSMPAQCMETVMVRIITSVDGGISNFGDYRPIAIASAISKLF